MLIVEQVHQKGSKVVKGWNVWIRGGAERARNVQRQKRWLRGISYLFLSIPDCGDLLAQRKATERIRMLDHVFKRLIWAFSLEKALGRPYSICQYLKGGLQKSWRGTSFKSMWEEDKW